MEHEIDGSCTEDINVSTKNNIKNVASKINDSKEDSNRNITHFPNSKVISENLSPSKHCVSLNGPNGLVNGLEIDKYNVKICDSSVCKQSSKTSSSREKCVNKNAVCDCEGSKVGGSDELSKCENSLKGLVLNSDSHTAVNSNEDTRHQAVSRVSENRTATTTCSSEVDEQPERTISQEITYVSYENEHQMPDIMRLIQKDLSEPYSIYTYRYFIHKWPQLCFLAMDGDTCVGAIVCKLDIHRKAIRRGYIAMLAVDEKYRKRKIGTNLVLKAIRAMVADKADEIVLETEITNGCALRLYENLGFVRDKRLFRYYLNGVDALRLKLWLR